MLCAATATVKHTLHVRVKVIFIFVALDVVFFKARFIDRERHIGPLPPAAFLLLQHVNQ